MVLIESCFDDYKVLFTGGLSTLLELFDFRSDDIETTEGLYLLEEDRDVNLYQNHFYDIKGNYKKSLIICDGVARNIEEVN